MIKALAFSLLLTSLSVAASPLFESDEILQVELSGPLDSLSVKKREELPFVLKTDGVEHNIKVRLRGKSRTRVCRFPPMRFNFSESDTTQSIFSGQEKLKLVTHCRNKPASETDTLEEYAAYKIFNLISDVSYRVRLLHITYINPNDRPDKTPGGHNGFLIESAASLAARIGGEPLHLDGVSLGSLNNEQLVAMYIFQYMIGNTDYSLVMTEADDDCCHNGDIFEIDADRYYVPFDFDLAGVVNAKYAYPHPSLRMRTVKERRYRGFCTSDKVLTAALDRIEMHQAEILRLPQDIPGLSPEAVTTMSRYLNAFFKEAQEKSSLLRTFQKHCL